MILADTSVWADHFRHGDPVLTRLLDRGDALGHPWITGELALGHLRDRAEILPLLDRLPHATTATADELLGFINRHELFCLGIGYVDAQLLASTTLTSGAALWTRDRRLGEAAERLGIGFAPEGERTG